MGNQEKNTTLSRGLLKIVLSIYFIVTIFVTAIHVASDYYYTKSNIFNELEKLSQTYGPVLSNAMWGMDNDQIISTGKGIQNFDIIEGVIINSTTKQIYAGGTVLRDDKTIEVDEKGAETPVTKAGLLSYRFEVIFNFNNQERVLGNVTLFSSRKAIIDRLKIGFLFLLFNAALKTAVLIGLFLWAFRKYLISPLDNMREKIEKIDMDNLQEIKVEQSLHGKNELDSFQDSFNDMITALKTSHHDLRDVNLKLKESQGQLEERVDERTKELNEANEKLTLEKDRADKATKAKSAFIANVSHEIRTPLNAILGLTHISQKKSDNSDVKENLETISSAGEGLLRIINDVLDLSKLESGKFVHHPHDFNLIAELKEIYKIFELQAEEKSLDFKLIIADDCPSVVKLDKDRFRQILFNLLSNAFKFTEKGMIRISAKVLKKESKKVNLQIEVTDSGPGIDKGMQHKIFENFEQAQAGKPGTGLGLPISRKLAELMNGDLQYVDGESGANFRVLFNDLPCRYGEAQTRNEDELSIVKSSLDNLKVLAVDDNKSNLRVLAGFLEEAQIVSKCCESGKEAIDLYNDFMPDIILMDFRMPEMNGLECVEVLRKVKGFKGIIIMLSANVKCQEDDKFDLYVDGFLSKPYKQLELLELIHSLLKSSKSKNTAITVFREKYRKQIENCCTYMTTNDFSSLLSSAEVFLVENNDLELRSWLEKCKQLMEEFEFDLLKVEVEKLL